MEIAGELPTGVSVSYTNNKGTNAGVYNAVASFTGDADNYNAIPDKTAVLTINKATYNMEGISFLDKTVTYNGQQFKVEIAGELPTGVSVSYTNNKGTNAGVYNAVASFTGDADNYNAIPDKTAVLTINKATYNMEGISFLDKTVTYNGQQFKVEIAGELPTGVSVAYENNAQTNAGKYTITASFTGDADNYNAIPNQTAVLTIEKATYDMSAVVFADKTVVYNGTAFSIDANNLPTGVSVTYENNAQTNAGEYTITASFTGDADNYNAIPNQTAVLTIEKATYDMSAVVFADKAVVYNGTAFSIDASNLPTGVSVAYENNGQTNVGIYTITAKFTGNENYNAIPDKTAVLTIKTAMLTFDTDGENDLADDIVITAPDGIDPTKQLVVELIEVEKDTKDYQEFIDKNQKVAVAYDVKLLQEGASVQPDGTLQFKVVIPMELLGKDFKIIHIHNGTEKSIIEYQTEGNYAVFECDKLSEFIFVYDMGSMLWLIILLGAVALLEIAFLVFLSKKNSNDKRLASAYPPFVFGMFLPMEQLVLVIVFAVVVAVLAVVSIICAIKVLNKKQLVEEIAVAEETVTEETTAEEVVVAKTVAEEVVVAKTAIEETVDEEELESETNGGKFKSFSVRLSQCSPEVIEYYNEIKNELLSYKKVKAKISLRHESFRMGMPVVARLKIRGKSLYLFLALDPNEYKGSKYKIKDASNVNNSKDVPTMYKISVPRRAVYAKELIADLMKKYGVEKK